MTTPRHTEAVEALAEALRLCGFDGTTASSIAHRAHRHLPEGWHLTNEPASTQEVAAAARTPKLRAEHCTETQGFPCTNPYCLFHMTEDALLQPIRARIKASAEQVSQSGPTNVNDLSPELVKVFRLLLMATRSIEEAPAAHPLLTDAQVQIGEAISALSANSAQSASTQEVERLRAALEHLRRSGHVLMAPGCAECKAIATALEARTPR